ncbi:phosphate ABC transporter ATP-binding protein [Wenzhouxiangella sp. XN24]|uniref:ABC transporter ATP-binding protein n=1 Tax=Wenzhouxiangella sp. XN24 TaxID=2713569 RepID=UPI003211D49D
MSGVHTALMPLEVRGLRFVMGEKRILDDVSFVIGHTARTVVLGPNGAGKSVLLKLCHGLLRPTAGSISWSGRTPAQDRRRRGMVFQRPVLLRRSVAANLRHGLRLHGVVRTRQSALAREALQAAGLEDKAEQSARTLSGGEQQRLAMARAWVLRPEVLLLDEPTANLDPAATRSIEQLIRGFEAAGTHVIMTTHDIGQARRLATDVLFIHHGRLLEHSPAERFFAAPSSPAAAQFIRGDLLA